MSLLQQVAVLVSPSELHSMNGGFWEFAASVCETECVVARSDVQRCPWALSTPDYIAYHDTEWGVPISGDTAYFERLTYEAFQSGLSWLVIMRKRPAFRVAFHDFDPERVARFGSRQIDALLANADIVRNRQKIEATITNARALMKLWETQGSDALEQLMLTHRPTETDLRKEGFRRPPRELADLPTQTQSSKALAKALKARGFVFVGPTTLYAGMQANGIVNDHLKGCFRRNSTM